MIRKGTFMLVAACLAAALAACGGGGGGAGGEDASAAEAKNAGGAGTGSGRGDKIVIRYWYAFGGKIEEAKRELVRRFNESQDRIEVIAEHQGNYEDLHAKVQAAFAAGNAPAVTDLEIASTGMFARSGMLLELTPYAERDAEELKLDDFHPGLMGNAYVDGKLYGLPFMRSTPILYKNVTMLKEAGLDPEGPRTWRELEQYARALKAKGTYGMTLPIDIWFYEALVFQSGGRILSEDGRKALFNSPEGVEPVAFWKRLAEEGLIKIPIGDEAGTAADKDWANQISALRFASTANVSAAIEIAEGNGFELATSFMPANRQYGVPTGGCQLVITSKLSDEEKEAAWEFLKFMTTTESTIFQHRHVGYLPTRLSALETDELQAHFERYPQYKVAFEQLAYAQPRPMENAYPEITMLIRNAIEKAILDPDVTPQEAMDEAAAKADKLLAK